MPTELLDLRLAFRALSDEDGDESVDESLADDDVNEEEDDDADELDVDDAAVADADDQKEETED